MFCCKQRDTKQALDDQYQYSEDHYEQEALHDVDSVNCGEIPPHIRRMMMIYGGLGYGAPHLRWGGGVIYFCEVVCVALGSYLN